MSHLQNPDQIGLAVLLVLAALFLLVVAFRSHDLREVNVISVQFFTHVLAVMLPACVYLYDPTKPAAASLSFFWGAFIAAPLMPLGGILGDIVVPITQGRRHAFLRDHVVDTPAITRATLQFTFVLLVMCLFNLAYVVLTSTTYPLKALLSAEVATSVAKAARLSFSKQQNLATNFFMLFFMPVLFLISVLTWKKYKGVLNKIFVSGCIVVALLNNSYSSRKTPIAIMFVLLFFTWLISGFQRKSHGWRKWLLPAVTMSCAIGYPLFIFSQLPAGQQSLPMVIWQDIIGRIFITPSVNNYAAFLLFPHIYNFSYFTDVGIFSKIFGFHLFDIGQVVGVVVHDQVTDAPPPSIGTFYAEAGWPGLVIGTLFASAILRGAENALIQMVDKTYLSMALYTFLLYGAFRFSWGYFTGILFSEAVIPVFLIVGMCMFAFPGALKRPRSRPATSNAVAQDA